MPVDSGSDKRGGGDETSTLRVIRRLDRNGTHRHEGGGDGRRLAVQEEDEGACACACARFRVSKKAKKPPRLPNHRLTERRRQHVRLPPGRVLLHARHLEVREELRDGRKVARARPAAPCFI